MSYFQTDVSSFIAESGRLTFLYIQIPLNGTGQQERRKKRSTSGVQVDAIGIKMGDTGIVNMVPLTLASNSNSGLRIVKTFETSAVYELQVNVT
jgi:hypothetical protein